MTSFFWICFFLILTNYLLFPLFVIALARFVRRDIRKGRIRPDVTLIISAYNEAAIIMAKLQNCLELDYPRDHLQIIVVSDGSTDRTPDLVEAFMRDNSGARVMGLHRNERRGKASAMNHGVAAACGEILVFSDANTSYHKDALLHLVENFSDATVGGVSGRKAILKEKERASSLGDRLFWTFEAALKRSESLVGSIPTADGEIFAIRASLYHPLPQGTINDDTAITFDIVEAGLRVVYDPLAVSEESASFTLREDMAVKARMVYGGYQSLARYHRRLLPPRTFFAFQFFCHKTLRHWMPFLLIGLFASNLFVHGYFYAGVFWAQVTFYLAALAGAAALGAGRPLKPLYLPLYYCSMNLSAVSGLVHFLKGRSVNEIWTKAERSEAWKRHF